MLTRLTLILALLAAPAPAHDAAHRGAKPLQATHLIRGVSALSMPSSASFDDPICFTVCYEMRLPLSTPPSQIWPSFYGMIATHQNNLEAAHPGCSVNWVPDPGAFRGLTVIVTQDGFFAVAKFKICCPNGVGGNG